jgi:Family of unknown function (DUF6493)
VSDPLIAALDAGDATAVVEALAALSEVERLARTHAVATRMHGLYWWSPGYPQLCLALLGTAPDAVAAAAPLTNAWSVLDQEAMVRVLLDRRPGWLAALVPMLPPGRSTRQLLAAGFGDRPPAVAVAQQLISSTQYLDSGVSIEDMLRRDPEVFDDDIFTLFGSAEHGQWLALRDGQFDRPRVWMGGQDQDPTPERTWRATLARLARSGEIDLHRLVEACLRTFTQDARASDLTWYAGLHKELRLTTSELADHALRYVRLLSAEPSFVVRLAQQALAKLLPAKAVDPEAVVEASAGPLHRAEKTIVVEQVKLLDRIARDHPSLVAPAVAAAATALEHPRIDVQEAALAMIGRHGGLAGEASTAAAAVLSPLLADAGRAAGIEAATADASAEDRSGVAGEWKPTGRSSPPTGVSVEVAVHPPPLGPALPASPEDLEQVVELMSEVLERPHDAMVVERMMGAAVRTAGQPLDERGRAGAAVHRRAMQLLQAQALDYEGAPAQALAAVVHAWVTGEVLRRSVRMTGDRWHYRLPELPVGLLIWLTHHRGRECAELISTGESWQLLSEPTHESGALAADVLLERVTIASGRGLPVRAPLDVDLAALRLVRELPDGYWSAMSAADADLGAQLRERWQAVGPVELIVEAIEDEPRASWLKRDKEVAGAARLAAPVPPVGILWPMLTDQSRDPDAAISYDDLAPWLGAHVAGWLLAAPWHGDLVAGTMLRSLSAAQYPSNIVAPEAATLLTLLGRRTGSLGPAGRMVLALGVLGHSADVRACAGEAIRQAFLTDRLDPALLAAALGQLADLGAVKTTRLIDALRPIVTDPVVGYRVLQTLTALVPRLLDTQTRDVHQALSLCSELHVRFGGPAPDGVASLAAQPGSSRKIIEARRLLKLADGVTMDTGARPKVGVNPPCSAPGGRTDLDQGLSIAE